MQVTKNKSGTQVSVGDNVHFVCKDGVVQIIKTLTNDIKSVEVFSVSIDVAEFDAIVCAVLDMPQGFIAEQGLSKEDLDALGDSTPGEIVAVPSQDFKHVSKSVDAVMEKIKPAKKSKKTKK